MDYRSLNILSLCAGVGGLDLGIRVAQPNARAVCFVEIEAFACEILATRMEDKTMDEAPVWADLRSFNGKPWRGIVDCITAGYPCQPFSVAGKQKGKDDPRHLWPDVYRIVREVRPRLCFFENVPGHLRLGFEQVHDDLQRLGYRVKAGLFSAEEVGASHKRERLFILAYRESDRANGWLSQLREIQRTDGCGHAIEPAGSGEASLADSPCLFCEWPVQEGDREQQSEMPSGSVDCELGNTKHAGSSSCKISRSHEEINGTERSTGGQISPEQSAGADHVADTDCLGTQIPPSGKLSTEQWINGNSYPFPPGPEGNWDEIPACFKPAICRMADGLANRVDRIRACGNGVVPLAAAHAWGILTTAANGGK